jgi:GAF domain-containing protein
VAGQFPAEALPTFRQAAVTAYDHAFARLIQLLTLLANSPVTRGDYLRPEARAKVTNKRLIEERELAALTATNEAILRARSQDELLQRVCEAAVSDGGFRTAGALLPESDGSLRFVALVGVRNTSGPVTEIRISIHPDSLDGQGLAGSAFRHARTFVANDFMNDPRLHFWRQRYHLVGVGAAVAVPILRNGQSAGVLLFYVAEAGAFTEEAIKLVERMAENVSFGLEMFERELQKERLAQMFAALSATNEAIMRAPTRSELFTLVCEAAVMRGKFTTVTVALHERGDTFLRIVSCSGPNRNRVIGTQFSIDPAHPAGKGMTGTAFRTRQTCIQNDFQQTKAVSTGERKQPTPRPAAVCRWSRMVRSSGYCCFFQRSRARSYLSWSIYWRDSRRILYLR